MHLTLASFIVGILIGLTSMGGAALMTPFLLMFGGLSAATAIGTDLVYGALTKIFGAGVHFKQGSVDLRVAFRLAIGSVPASFLGFLCAHNLHRLGINSDQWTRRAVGIVLVVVAASILYRTIFLQGRVRRIPAKWMTPMTIVAGAVVGFTVGLTSIGSGSLLAPFLVFLFPKDTSRVVGTDVFHAAILVSISAIFYINVGQVDWHLVPNLLAGSIPGVLIGSMLATRIPTRSLRFGVSVLLFATGYGLLWRH